MAMAMNTLRVGTTEGRFRMIMPDLLAEFGKQNPGVRIEGVIGNAEQLREMLCNGTLDLAFSGISPLTPECIKTELLFDERLFLVVSDQMLQDLFPERYPSCIEEFRSGADLRDFEQVLFCFSLPELHCMKILDDLLRKQGIRLHPIHVSPHFDLHQELAVRNYAACFCLSMYIPHLKEINERYKNKLYYFPIKGLCETNPVYILTNRDRTNPACAESFKSLLKAYVAGLLVSL